MNNEENKIKSELAVHTETYCRKSDFKPHFQIVILDCGLDGLDCV